MHHPLSLSSSWLAQSLTVILSIVCIGCPSEKETGAPCIFGATTSTGENVSACYDAKGATESTACDSSWSPELYPTCKKRRQGDGTWAECPGKDHLWVQGVAYGSYGETKPDEEKLAAHCAAADKALGLDDDGNSDEGIDVGVGMHMGWRTWGPGCSVDDPETAGWYCVDCEAESMNTSPPYGVGVADGTNDIQVWSQCATACVRWDQSFNPGYDNPTDQQSFQDAIKGSCDILSTFDSNNASNGITSNYRSECAYCPDP